MIIRDDGSVEIHLEKEYNPEYVAHMAAQVVYTVLCGLDSRGVYYSGINSWWGIPTYEILPHNQCVISIDKENKKAYLSLHHEYGQKTHIALAKAIEGFINKGTIPLRDCVNKASSWMETKLIKNESRGGWKDCTDSYLIEMLYEHIEKLKFSLQNGHELGTYESVNKVYSDAADCQNILMMLADNFERRNTGA